MTPKQKEELIKKFVEDKDQSQVPPEVNKDLCEGCTICCEHVALEIDEPEDKEDFETIMWYVMHENVWVYIADEDEGWYLEFKARCRSLDGKGLCKVHRKRPAICREYSQDSCEKHSEGSPYKVLFKEPEQVVEWVRKNTEFKDFMKEDK